MDFTQKVSDLQHVNENIDMVKNALYYQNKVKPGVNIPGVTYDAQPKLNTDSINNDKVIETVAKLETTTEIISLIMDKLNSDIRSIKSNFIKKNNNISGNKIQIKPEKVINQTMPFHGFPYVPQQHPAPIQLYNTIDGNGMFQYKKQIDQQHENNPSFGDFIKPDGVNAVLIPENLSEKSKQYVDDSFIKSKDTSTTDSPTIDEQKTLLNDFINRSTKVKSEVDKKTEESNESLTVDEFKSTLFSNSIDHVSDVLSEMNKQFPGKIDENLFKLLSETKYKIETSVKEDVKTEEVKEEIKEEEVKEESKPIDSNYVSSFNLNSVPSYVSKFNKDNTGTIDLSSITGSFKTVDTIFGSMKVFTPNSDNTKSANFLSSDKPVIE